MDISDVLRKRNLETGKYWFPLDASPAIPLSLGQSKLPCWVCSGGGHTAKTHDTLHGCPKILDIIFMTQEINLKSHLEIHTSYTIIVAFMKIV